MLTGDLTGLIVEKRKIRNVARIEFLKRFASQRFWSHLDWGKESFEQGISQRFVTSTQHCAMEGTGAKFVWVIHAWSFFFITVEIYEHLPQLRTPSCFWSKSEMESRSKKDERTKSETAIYSSLQKVFHKYTSIFLSTLRAISLGVPRERACSQANFSSLLPAAAF